MKQIGHPYLAALLITLTAQSAAAERLPDPTRPAHAKASPAKPVHNTVRLEAVMQSEGRLLAIVNGKLVRAGDRVDDAYIEEVLTDGIRYTRAGQSQTLALKSRAMQVRRNVVGKENE